MNQKRYEHTAPIVEAHMPNATPEEKQIANEKLLAYIEALVRLYIRIHEDKQNDVS